ncbi:hypothetical protein J6590_035113 [Homalodisca vitripennis]|nr:hypothetical protein J6590_035113 [Homalodisca vitripennis]
MVAVRVANIKLQQNEKSLGHSVPRCTYLYVFERGQVFVYQFASHSQSLNILLFNPNTALMRVEEVRDFGVTFIELCWETHMYNICSGRSLRSLGLIYRLKCGEISSSDVPKGRHQECPETFSTIGGYETGLQIPRSSHSEDDFSFGPSIIGI